MSFINRRRLREGQPFVKGATWDGSGVNFALFSANATKVELCLFDRSGRHEIERIELPEYTDEIWHGYLTDIRPGQLYGYRVHGPYAPEEGHRFNPHKLLMDPYAKSLAGPLKWHDANFGYRIGHSQQDLSFDKRDNMHHVPKCRVIDPAFTWGPDHRRRRKWTDSIIYEVHVKGFTQTHPDIEEPIRGTFAGLSSPEAINYLVKLGVTAVELLPIHSFVQDRFLVDKGLRNYWGYNTIGFFSVESGYLARQEDIDEFRTCIRKLHDAGIEVILDVVYNHTAEGNHLGPTLSFKGIDNASYYRLSPEDPRYYYDTTGCGNALNLSHPRVLQMVMDSLRYWVLEMHIDGFRFDLASTLAREGHGFDNGASFFHVIQQDPILSKVKLIAEPWDLGSDGYQVGGYPPGWSEWNDKFRDTAREYWRGDEHKLADFASRISGSSDLYDHRGRRPWASINFITAHDGFTLHDLVSYNKPHNEANQEQGGHADNKSWNCGAEGPTDDPEVRVLRQKQKRNLLATLMLSQGVPMLLGGDELGRTQQGNNNAYCQDSEISWFDWANISEADEALFEFTRQLIAFRRSSPAFRRGRFYKGDDVEDTGMKDLTWFNHEGEEFSDEEWSIGYARVIGQHMHHKGSGPFMVLMNAYHDSIPFTLPPEHMGKKWRVVFDTTDGIFYPDKIYEAGNPYPLQARSLAVLEMVKEGDAT